jgi:hypothetical protein
VLGVLFPLLRVLLFPWSVNVPGGGQATFSLLFSWKLFDLQSYVAGSGPGQAAHGLLDLIQENQIQIRVVIITLRSARLLM